MLEHYDFLKAEGFVGVDALPRRSRGDIEAMVDLWWDLEGVIPKDENLFHELFSRYPERWREHLRIVKPDWSSVVRGWWLENARIRYNEPERYELRYIRKDWYGKEEDPHVYSGKVLILPLRRMIPGLKIDVPAEDDYDSFHKVLKDMVWADVFNYDILRLWPKPEWGVRDVQPARAKACAGIIIVAEKGIGEKKILEFTDVYGVAVRTCVFMKPSTLSDWAVVKEFTRKVPTTTPILLVTLADYDFDGITGTHFGALDHFRKYYPTVHHLIGGVFPEQVPPERLHPGDALYELKPKTVRYWLRAVREGKIPPDMGPVEYEGRYYGIEMDAVGARVFLPTIVDKLEELGCTQEAWTDWARERSLPPVEAVEERVAHAQARDLDKYREIESIGSKISSERWRKVEEYDEASDRLRRYGDRLRDLVREKMRDAGRDIAEEPDFDDRLRPPPHTLKRRVAEQPLEPYEEYWDPETRTGFSEEYLTEKLEEGLEDEFEERREEIEVQVEEAIQPDLEPEIDGVIRILNEIRTRSRVE